MLGLYRCYFIPLDGEQLKRLDFNRIYPILRNIIFIYNGFQHFVSALSRVKCQRLGGDENINLKEIADSCNILAGGYRKLTHEEIPEIFEEANG